MRMHMPKEQKKNVQKGRASDSYPSGIRSPFPEMDRAGVLGIPEETKFKYDVASASWDKYLENYDVMISPIFPCEAWVNESGPHTMLADAQVLSRKLRFDGEERFYGDCLFWSHLSVLFGLPATGFPVCFTPKGNEPLPVGLQAIGAKGNDFIVLDIVQKLMKELGMNQFQPPQGFA